MQHGQGMYIWANGDRYQSAWKDGKKHRPGIYFYLADNEFKGDTYVGEYDFAYIMYRERIFGKTVLST